jgi:CheY-like chemotaxis protein
VILLDIGLPGIDGFHAGEDAARAAGDQRRALIAVSGYGQEKDRTRVERRRDSTCTW